MRLHNRIESRGWSPTDEAALKLIDLGLQNISEKWTLPIREWKAALN
jgi:putative transposase